MAGGILIRATGDGTPGQTADANSGVREFVDVRGGHASGVCPKAMKALREIHENGIVYEKTTMKRMF